MIALNDVVAYLGENSESPLVRDRLTDLVYLADWKSSIDYSERLTDIEWRRTSFTGPFLELEICVEDDPGLSFKPREISFPLPTKLDPYVFDELVVEEGREYNFPPNSERALNHIIGISHKHDFQELDCLVDSTYPMWVVGDGTEVFDLLEFAKEYKEFKRKSNREKELVA